MTASAAPPLPQLLVNTPAAAATGGRRKARAAAAASTQTVRSTEGTNAYVLTLDAANTAKPLLSLRSLIESLKPPKGGKKGELAVKRWRFHSVHLKEICDRHVPETISFILYI